MRVVLDAPPNSLTLYAKAAFSSGGRGDRLPDTELVLPRVSVDRAQLAAYARVCGYPIGDELPGCYPHVLGFPLGLQLMTSDDFPFPAKGLVHVANQLTVRRAMRADDELTVRVRLEGLAAHRRGKQFEVVTEVDAGDDNVWSERSTYLRREKRAGGSRTEDRPADVPLSLAARWQVPAGIGRKYAAVSGDYNPIHLHPLSARLFGYRRPIAHGMWTMARCLAAFRGRLPESYVVDVSFAAPIFLPSPVTFRVDRKPLQGWDFEVRGGRSDRCVLRGTIRSA